MLPSLKPNQFNLFLCNKSATIDRTLKAYYFNNISHDEQQKYQRFHFEKDQKLYLLSHAMVRLVLSEYLGCSPQSLTFSTNEYNKPSLKSHPEICFNLSHSNHAVALIVGHSDQVDLGIDIEFTTNRGHIQDLAEQFFSAEESSFLLNQPPEYQTDLFFKFWTLKEAYIKAIGQGLSIDLASFYFSFLDKNVRIKHHSVEELKYQWCFYHTQPFDHYHLSIAIRNQTQAIEQFNLKPHLYQPGVACEYYPLNFVQSSTV